MKEFWAAVLTDVDAKEYWTRVYVAEEVDAIPKLELSDLEMRQVRDLLSVAVWIRSIQLNSRGIELNDIIGELDKVFVHAQMDSACKLIDKFTCYLVAHTELSSKELRTVWPTGGLADV